MDHALVELKESLVSVFCGANFGSSDEELRTDCELSSSVIGMKPQTTPSVRIRNRPLMAVSPGVCSV